MSILFDKMEISNLLCPSTSHDSFSYLNFRTVWANFYQKTTSNYTVGLTMIPDQLVSFAQWKTTKTPANFCEL